MNNFRRKNQTLMPMSKSSIHDTLAANSKRFSDMPNRLVESEMRQKLYQVKLKNYNPDKMRAKVRWNLIITVIVCFLIFFGNGISQYRDKHADVVFCDSDSYNYLDKSSDCTPCPNYGKCEGGNLISCYENYIIKNNTCVRNEKLDLLIQKMVQKLGGILALRKGDEICYGFDSNYGFIPLKDIKSTLNDFSYDKNFDTALEQLRYELMPGLNKYPNLITEFKIDPVSGFYEDFIASRIYDLNPFCKAKLFIKDHRLSIFAFVIICLVMTALAKQATKRRRLTIRAEELYKKNLSILQSEQKINRKNLLVGELDHNVKDRDALLEEIERIRLIDEQITLYQSEGEVYWVLV